MQPARTAFILAGAFLSCSVFFTVASNPLAALAPKPPEIEVVDISLHRKDGTIEVDTTVRNVGQKPINGLTAVYHFFAPGRTPVTTQKTRIDEPVLEPNADATIHAQLEEPARAVTVEFSAVDAMGRELRVKNTGPFSIE